MSKELHLTSMKRGNFMSGIKSFKKKRLLETNASSKNWKNVQNGTNLFQISNPMINNYKFNYFLLKSK